MTIGGRLIICSPDKIELRQEAIAQDLIGGVSSDYQVQPSSSSPLTSAVGVKSNRHAIITEYIKAYNPSDQLITIFRNIGLIYHKIFLGWFIRREIINFSVYSHL